MGSVWPMTRLPTRPARAAGESGTTSLTRTCQTGSDRRVMSVKMSQAMKKLTMTPASRMPRRLPSRWFTKARGSSDSPSSPSSRTKPPMGSQLSE